jgi:branched-chain amino acid transport system permease protein
VSGMRMIEAVGVASHAGKTGRHVSGFTRPQLIALGVMVALITACPFVLYPVFLMKILCFALFACAFNLLVGFVGLMSFGHAAYFGMGAYVAAWLMKSGYATPELAILAGGGIGAVLGAVLGGLAIRRQGLYFAMITLALAQMVYFFCLQAPFTGGEDGLQDVPRGKLFGVISLDSDITLYWFVAAIFLAGFLFIFRVIDSPFGRALKAIRENETRAISLGYNTTRFKLIAFILSCALSGVAGATKAIVFSFATLTDVQFMMSGEVLFMVLLGGMGTLFGPIVGAVITILLEFYLAPFGAWVLVIQGAIFFACVLTFRRGLIGELAAKLKLQL